MTAAGHSGGASGALRLFHLAQVYAEASQELASAMEAVDTVNREFFRAFKTVVPLLALAPHPSVEALMKSWYVWNQLNTHRDKLKQQFRARYHG